MGISRKCNLFNKVVSLVISLSLVFTPYGFTMPQDPSVPVGDVSIDTSVPDTMNIHQGSDKAIINWNSFSIRVSETVNFLQPGSGSVALNRVTGGSISEILGALNANGQVWLVNPNGIVFGANCSINAAGFLASTLNISDNSFADGSYVFNKMPGSNGYIINKGQITAKDHGYVTMLSQAIRNEGGITANLGKVVLASGEKMTVAMDSFGMISVAIDEAVTGTVIDADGNVFEDAVLNAGEISADGGTVILTASVLENIFQKAVNNEGLIKANSLVEKKR